MKNCKFMKIKMMYVLILAFSLMSMKAKADALWVGQTKTCEVSIWESPSSMCHGQ